MSHSNAAEPSSHQSSSEYHPQFDQSPNAGDLRLTKEREASAAALAKRKANQLEQVHVALGAELSPEDEQWLTQRAGSGTLDALLGWLYEKLRSATKGAFGARWKPINGNRALVMLSPAEQKEWGLPQQVGLLVVEGCRCLLMGEAHLVSVLRQKGEARREVMEGRANEFEADRPAWFSRDQLLAWSRRQGREEKKKSSAKVKAHPIADCFENFTKDDMRQLGLSRVGSDKYETEAGGVVTVGGVPVTITQKALIRGLPNKAWSQKDCGTLKEAVAAVKIEEAKRWVTQVQRVFDHPESGAIWSPAVSEKYSLPEKEWGEFVGKVFAKTGPAELSSFSKEMKKALEGRLYDLQILACAKALPDHLGEMYPVARRMRRKLKLVIGPTNSGKTYRALERLKAAESGLYLGPLRLLALEVRDRLEDEGHPTSLVTGELMEPREGARYAACTVEMLDFDEPKEIAIIDEVQMLGDLQRGSAWVQAIIGAPAREVWMLGSPEAEDAVCALAEYLSEEIEIIRTERLTPMEIDSHATPLENIPEQSAIVAFSRRAVLDIAAELQSKHRRSCAVVYGALSPEVRREQAERFRSGEVEYVVATDSISMGLNLPVKGVYFSADTKWNGQEDDLIPQDLAWQIAGRAGRFGHYDAGRVGALNSKTLRSVKKMLATRPEQVDQRYAHGPTWPLVRLVSQHLSTDNLQKVLSVFEKDLKLSVDRRFYPTLMEHQMTLAKLVDRESLQLKNKLALSAAPVPFHREEVAPEYVDFVKAVALGAAVPLASLKYHLADHAQRNQETAEGAVKMLTLYCWLHYRFPESFPDLEEAQEHIGVLNEAISNFLRRHKGRKCKQCSKPLAWHHKFALCDTCHDGQ